MDVKTVGRNCWQTGFESGQIRGVGVLAKDGKEKPLAKCREGFIGFRLTPINNSGLGQPERAPD